MRHNHSKQRKLAATTNVTAVTFLLLGICAPAALAQTDVVSVTGLVRDFHRTDAIINTTPAAGAGHYARNVNLALNASWQPTYTATGFKVNTQWRDVGANNIPPHLFSQNTAVVKLANAPTINNNPTIDTFNSAIGPYGGANVGPAPAIQTGQAMPSVAAPSPLPAFITDILYQGSGTSTLSVNRYCKTFTLKDNRVLRISGNIFIYCTETFKIENGAKLQILANSSLHVYIGKNCTLQNNVEVNVNTWTPSKFTITNLGTETIVLENTAHVYGTIISPYAPMHVKNSNNFYGNFTGKSLILDNTAGFHIDGTTGAMVCGSVLNDTAGAAGTVSGGGITNASDFLKWFADVPGTNASRAYTIDLVKDGTGIFEYYNDSFLPIDHQIFGNEGQAHNYYFTFVVDIFFTHDACASPTKFVEFRGADDCWIYVNSQLGIDLGGLTPMTKQRLDVDRLNLVDGQTYVMRVFYAQRNTAVAHFHLRTNLDLLGSAEPGMVTAAFD